MNKTATVLSDRELEVLQLLSQGRTNAEIAGQLSLSIHTVANHRKNMLVRSRCSNCLELVRTAMHENLL
jgi:DNA-binding CsgD family transcriptional regulator